MKKRIFGRKLGRERDSRRALFRGLIISLIENGSVRTTLAKAKAVTPEIDGVVNLAKVGSTASLRKVHAFLGNNKIATKKLSQIVKKMDGRMSGYARMMKVGARQGDMAEMAKIEWVDSVETSENPKAISGKEKAKSSTKKAEEKAVKRTKKEK